MVYPETKTKNILSRAWNFVVGQSSKGDSLFIPDHDSMQEKALEVYLDTYRKNLIECELSHHLDIVQIAEHVYHIFKQLHKQKISESRESEWKAEKLPLVCFLIQYLWLYVIIGQCMSELIFKSVSNERASMLGLYVKNGHVCRVYQVLHYSLL